MDLYSHFTFAKRSSAGVITIPNIGDSRHIIIAVDADATTTATIKFQGSILQAVPDFSEAAAIANPWAYVAFRDLGTASLTAGATGISISSATHHKLYEIESNGLAHLGIELSSVSGDGVAFQVFVRND